MTKTKTFTYWFECFDCRRRVAVETTVMWDDRSRLLPESWVYRVKDGFCHTLCPSCKRK